MHTLSYVTWNKTNFPVPNGSRNFKVMAAIIAQKKLLQWSKTENFVIPGDGPSPHDLRGEEIRYFLQTKQDATDRRTKRNCNTSGGGGAQDLAPFAWTLTVRSYPTGIRDEPRLRKYSPSFVSYLTKKRLTMFPMQLAMCTKGPSLPRRGC